MTAPLESPRYRFFARWGDMDFNAHMRNTAYLDVSGDTRMLFFQSQGFTAADFSRLRIGPVILKDELEYFKEIHLLDPYDVTLTLLELSEDGSRFKLRNDFLLPTGKLAARVTSSGGWLDLTSRRLSPPPPPLLAVLSLLPRP
jgi:acyl-CoA thioester hydrolase